MKKMLKAVAGIAVAGLLVIGICATVFAAPSPVVSGDVASDNPNFYATPGAAATQLDEGTARQMLGLTGGTVAIYNWDMGTTDHSPATVTFSPAGATAGQTLTVLHFHNGAWQVEGQGAGPTITVTFTDFSPVALVVYTPAGGASGGGNSPKTGQADFLLYIALAAVAIGGVTAGLIARNKA